MTTRSTVLPPGFFPPVPDELDAPYWDGLRHERLLLQCCTNCGQFQWLPEVLCYRCHSRDVVFTEVAAAGRLYSWTRVWHPVKPELADFCPYLIGIVQIDNASKVRLIGNLVGLPDGVDPEIGSTAFPVFEHHEDYSLLQWSVTDATEGTP